MAIITVREKIIAGNKKFMAAFGQRDGAGVAKLYTKTGQLLPPGREPVVGRPDIQVFWQGAMDAGLTQAQLETVEVELCRETAIEVGKFTLMTASGQIADAGKYLVVWKREAGAWKLHRDIWNSSKPPAQ
jgi:ketosteroid isomerase-like protein